MKQFTLPKEFAEKWVAELRSGRYMQTTHKLCDGVGFCCLGLAGVVAGHSKGELEGHSVFGPKYTGTIPVAGLPALVESLVPVELYGNATDNKLVEKLTDLNDREWKTFPEIANWIIDNVEFV